MHRLRAKAKGHRRRVGEEGGGRREGGRNREEGGKREALLGAPWGPRGFLWALRFGPGMMLF